MPSFFKQKFEKTRFAPSPTGYLHRGHILSAIWVWGMARLSGAKIHLRMEDHDQSRCREIHVDAILEDLEWLGFQWDTYSRQSEHFDRFEAHFRNLQTRGLLYACECSRKELGLVEKYPGTCKFKLFGLEPGQNRGIRIALNDQIVGDPLIRDRLDQWTYQFAVSVDDLEEGVDLVVRGADLESSTALQIQIASLCGRTNPAHYWHHSLLVDSTGQKLSKRQLARSIRADKAEGLSPEELLGSVCCEAGIILKPRKVELAEVFELVHKARGLVEFY